MKAIDITCSKDLKKVSDVGICIGLIDLLVADAYIFPAMWARYNEVLKKSYKKVKK